MCFEVIVKERPESHTDTHWAGRTRCRLCICCKRSALRCAAGRTAGTGAADLQTVLCHLHTSSPVMQQDRPLAKPFPHRNMPPADRRRSPQEGHLCLCQVSRKSIRC